MVESLFHAALERELDTRPAFLEVASGGDSDLQRQVELLVAKQEAAVSFLETPAMEGTATPVDAGSLLGKQVGPYRILCSIGAGGMGSVFFTPLARTLLRERSPEQSLDLFYTTKGYDKTREPKLDDVDKQGLGPDYVYRETKRCVEAVAGRAKTYSGIGIDLPANNQTFASNPEGVYQAVYRAFDAGAADVLISCAYDEMRLPNLRAVGRAMAELPKDEGDLNGSRS